MQYGQHNEICKLLYQSEISMLMIKYFTHQETSPKGEEELLSHQLLPPAPPSNPSHPAPLPHIFRPPHCPLRSCSQDSSSIHFIHLPPKQTTAFHINWLGLVPFPKTSNPCHLRKTRKKWSPIIVTNSFTMLSRRFRNSLNTDIRALNPWIGRSATLNEFDWGITLCTIKKHLVKPSNWAWTQFCQAQM